MRTRFLHATCLPLPLGHPIINSYSAREARERPTITDPKKKKRLDRASIAKESSRQPSCWDHLETLFYMSALKRKSFANDVIPLNSVEGKFFLNVILTTAYSKLYRESSPNKMAPLASIMWEQEQ